MNYELQCVIKASPHETNYRKDNCQDISSVDGDNIHCSACGERLIPKSGRCYINRVVGTLQCQFCHDRYEAVKPWEPANRHDFCVICGQSSEELQKCSRKDCSYSSCQTCIQRNVLENAISTDKRKWNCYICSIKQLYSRRAVAAAVMASLSEESCDREMQKEVTRGNENNESTLSRKRDRRRVYKKSIIYSSDSDVLSDMSDENVFQKKPTTQKPSISVTPSSSSKTKSKSWKVNSTYDDGETLEISHNKRKDKSQMSIIDSRCLKSKRGTISANVQESGSHKSNDKKKKSTKHLNGSANIDNKFNNINKRFESLMRENSNSSSDKEFSRYKIIPSYVPLQRISNINKDYTTSPVNQSSPDDAISKQDAFLLKNHLQKFLHDMKKNIKMVQNRIEHIEKSYHYKEKIKADDATRMMIECTSMIQDLKQHVDSSEEKVVGHYDTWCKKAKIKNILACRKSSVTKADKPHRREKSIETSIVMDSSSSDSDKTLKNVPIVNRKTEVIEINPKQVRKTAVDGEESESSTDIISELDEKEIGSVVQPNNPLSPATGDSNAGHERVNGVVGPEMLEVPEKKRMSDKSLSTNKQSNDEHVATIGKVSTNKQNGEVLVEKPPKSVPATPTIEPINGERSSTPRTTPKQGSNYHDSPHSSIDMFEDEDEGKSNNENTPIKLHRKSITPRIQSRETTEDEKDIDEEEEKSKRAILLDSSSSDTDIEKTPRVSYKKSRNIVSSDEDSVERKQLSHSIDPGTNLSGGAQLERREKSPAAALDRSSDIGTQDSESLLTDKQLPESRRKIIDSSDERSMNTSPSIETANANEEQAKKALLDTSSDSERELSFEILNKQNNSFSGDDELSEGEDITKEKSKKKAKRISPSSVGENNYNSSSTSKSKREKFILSDNIHYKSNPKLRMITTVDLTRLGKNILDRHSNALKKSKEYLEYKQVKSLVSINNIEKKKKKAHASDSSLSSASGDGETLIKRPTKSKKKEKPSEETLMDHLNKAIENNGASDNNDDEDDEDKNSDSTNPASPRRDSKNDKDATENLTTAADKLYKAALLESSHSEVENDELQDEQQNNMVINDLQESKDESPKKDSVPQKNSRKEDQNEDGNSNNDESSEKDKRDKSSWKRSKILTVNFSDTDSEEEKRKVEKKIALKKEASQNSDGSDNKFDESEVTAESSPMKRKRARRRRLASDSDIKITDDSDNSITDTASKKNKERKNDSDDKEDGGKKARKRRKKSDNSSDSSSSLDAKKSKPKRKRIRAMADDSDSESGNELNNSQGRSSGRKNIRKVLKDKQVADDTKQAGKLEEERLRRMAERQKLYNEMYEARLANEEKVDKLILDFDEESKEVLLSVDENLVKRLKPHQARGIKFMWDAAYESLERAKTTSGSGCILAHCMGLGKSFQVVTLSHTLISNSEKTGVNTILIVAPLSTVLNWVNEFKIWLSEVENGDDIEIYEMTKCKTTFERKYQLESWMRTGGILIIGYEMFRNLTNATKKVKKNVRESILKCLIDPGPDLVICDEGHLLKNEDSAISKAMRRIKTLRRVVLTGTPLQNNLIEYHCMVQFVKPNLLGTKKEFSNRFVNPIQNGQFDDSTEYDVKVMKKRAHVLHKMLEGSVQRFDYSVLMPFLPPKQEYVILVRLTEVQVKLYQYYLDKLARQPVRVGSSLFADFQALQRIWTHPSVVKSYTEKMTEKRRDADSDSEGSLKDFIDDGSASDSSSVISSNNSDVVNLDSSGDEAKIGKRGTRSNPVNGPEVEAEPENKGEWWTEFVEPEHLEDMRVSVKLLLLFDIIKESEALGDKVLVFSQSLYSLTLIEKFLNMIDDETQKGNELETLDHHTGSWALGLDYFRFDGQTSADNRSHWVRLFNKPSNTRARLFLISTRAGGLGINLTAANRVVIFDASWNPSHDVQSIFRIYRFGQKKPCYVYRLLAAGTMEEKIYNRQVTKLSLSCRVVDEQQIERHFSNNDLAELYKFEPPKSEPSQLALPKDRLIAEIFLRHKNLVETYHEHDSLLENIAEEELDDEERKQAWLEYEEEKAGKRPMPTQMYTNYVHQHMLLQQFNNQMMNMNELNFQGEYQNILQFIIKDYPHLTEAARRDMAFRTVSNMYSYVENQVTTNLNNPANIPSFNNPTATLANVLAQQEYARQHATVNKYQQQQQQAQYAQKFGNNIGNVVTPTVRTLGAVPRDDDVVEIPPSGSRISSTLPTSSSTKSQEE